MGRARAQAGAPISTTGAALSPFSGAFGGMGGLDGFDAQQKAMNAGIAPGDFSAFTDPLTGVDTYGQDVTGGRSAYGRERIAEKEARLYGRQLKQAATASAFPQVRGGGGEEVPLAERGPEYYRQQRQKYLNTTGMFNPQGGLRSAASRALMG